MGNDDIGVITCNNPSDTNIKVSSMNLKKIQKKTIVNVNGVNSLMRDLRKVDKAVGR